MSPLRVWSRMLAAVWLGSARPFDERQRLRLERLRTG
jgi:hypothetical protein